MKTDVSVVIPTRDRQSSLVRCLSSLAKQTYPLREIIIVDAGDHQLNEKELASRFPNLSLLFIRETPSVCKQRNRGITAAGGTHVLLSDDDIEFSPDYVSTIVEFMSDHPDVKAASGILLEPSNSGYQGVEDRTMTWVSLCWRFFFQLTVWSDVEAIRAPSLGTAPLSWLQGYYRRRQNTFTPAGWPLVTQVGGDYFRTTIFGLGASIIERNVLVVWPFDEILDQHGIGDNYGIALNFPGDRPIAVLRTVSAMHHRSNQNRLQKTTTYYRRILALDYFMSRSDKFTLINRCALLWSLVGNLIPQVGHGDFKRATATIKAGILILFCRNPYLVAFRQGANTPVTPNVSCL